MEKYTFTFIIPKHVIKLSEYNLRYYNSSSLNRISSSKFIPESKSCEYCALIVVFGSQVASSLPWCCQNTFTTGTCLFRNCFTSRAIIDFGSFSYEKFSFTCLSCIGSMCDPSEQYHLSIDT